MLLKESKIKVLEAFYGIDYALFGKSLKNVDNCCPVIKEEYVSIKGALLSVYIEMLKLMEHTPEPLDEKVSMKEMIKNAKVSASMARNAAAKVVTTERARADIKAELKEALAENKGLDVTVLVESKIREKAFRLAVDNILVAQSLKEAKNLDNMKNWEGEIIEDSYKILRDSLCETAMMILDDEQSE
jgi:hypothetical protein